MPGPSTRPQDAPSGAHPPLPSHLTWTPEHEARLEYVQRELTAAQAAWSEEQDLWIDEVTKLQDLKRKCLKAEKKVMGGGKGRRANSMVGIILKRRSLSAKSKGFPAAGSPSEVCVDNDGEDEDEDEEEAEESDPLAEETRPTNRKSSISTLLWRTMSLGSKDPDAGGGRRNTVDGGLAVRPSLSTSPESSFSGAEGKVKGKGKLLKRRGSGR